jgi:hypothetical protein
MKIPNFKNVVIYGIVLLLNFLILYNIFKMSPIYEGMSPIYEGATVELPVDPGKN